MNLYRLYSKANGHKCLIRGYNEPSIIELINSDQELDSEIVYKVSIDDEFGKKDLLDFSYAGLPMLSKQALMNIEREIKKDIYAPIRCVWNEANSHEYYYGLRVKQVDCLDYSRAEFFQFSSGRRTVDKYAFLEDMLIGKYIFKIPEDTGVYVTQNFVDLVECKGLTGFSFQQIKCVNHNHSNTRNEHFKIIKSEIAVRDIVDEELLIELRENAQYGKGIIGSENSLTYEKCISTIYEAINNPKYIKKAAKNFDDDITGIAIGLGVLWGVTVCDRYQWNWRDIVFDNDEESIRTCIVSPKSRYYIDPINLFNDICFRRAKNDTLLLFNILDKIEDAYPLVDGIIELR